MTAPALALDVLAATNRPVQLELLETLARCFAAAPAVTDLLVRGSLATGRVDRLSDVDLVVGVHDAHLPELLDCVDELMRTTFGTVLPGWRDTIVADIGGTGFVHLLPHAGHLHQVDLYLAPTTRIAGLRDRTGAHPILHRAPNAEPTGEQVRACADRLAADRAEPASCSALLTEAVVLHAMLRKRVLRGQHYIAYGLLHQLHCVLRDLIKTALVPHSRHHGWYHLPEEAGASSLGIRCLDELDHALRTPAAPTLADVDESLDRIWRVAEHVAPHAVDSLRDALAAYRLHQAVSA